MSLRNRIAARLLDAVIERATFVLPADENPRYPKPAVWGHTIVDEVTGDPYLTRVLFPRIPAYVPLVGGMRPTLHKFHRPDADHDLHNHPWQWAVSIVLTGEYTEERLAHDDSALARRPITETRRVRWLNVLRRQDWHRISELHGEVYTLFCMGPRLSANAPGEEWGFMDESGRTMGWRRYLDLKLLMAAGVNASTELLDRLARRYRVQDTWDIGNAWVYGRLQTVLRAGWSHATGDSTH